MREILFVVVMAVSISSFINASKTEMLLWSLRIQHMNQAGQEWEASQITSNKSLQSTDDLFTVVQK